MHTAQQDFRMVFAMIKDFWFPVHFQIWIQIAADYCAAESQNTVLMCCVFSFRILTLDPLIKALGLLAGNCEYPTSNRNLYQKDGLQTPG